MAKGEGHPKGLYALFFTEMWERLAFYLMLGILILYCKDTERGGLAMTLRTAAEVFGTYMAFVYFTPFFGGMIADRYIGYRKAVFIGGLTMASGLFVLGARSETTLYVGLALICLGNGLFKPNISAMVGNLYKPGDPKRDAGFNIFYMGINIGAAASALLSAPLRNMYSFNMAFVAAGVGLLVGVTVLAFNWKTLAAADQRPEPTPEDVTLGKIFKVIVLPAAAFGALGWFIGIRVDAIMNSIGHITFAFLIGMLPVIFYFAMLVKNANPKEKPGMNALMPVYLAGGVFFMILHLNGGLMTVVAENSTDRQAEWIRNVPLLSTSYSQMAMPSYFDNADPDLPRPSPEMLVVVDDDIESMFGARMLDEASLSAVVTKYPDLNIVEKKGGGKQAEGYASSLACKIYKDGVVSVSQGKDSHGVTVTSVNKKPETAPPLRTVALVRETKGKKYSVIPVSEKTFDLVYNGASDKRLEPGESVGLVNAEMLTALFNPVFVVIITPLIVAFFAWRVRKGKQISTPRKIFYGMIITALALSIMAVGMYSGGDGASKISPMWIIVFYAVLTFGELCLSPMGLSLVTKLAPKRLVGLMMGGWFLANAIGNKMSGFISGLEPTTKMFLILGGLVVLVAGFIFFILPRLEKAVKQYGA